MRATLSIVSCTQYRIPGWLVFQKLMVLANMLQPLKAMRFTTMAELVDHNPPHRFSLCPGEYCSHQDLAFAEDEVIWSLSDTVHAEGFTMISFAKLSSLDTHLAGYAHRHRHSEGQSGHARSRGVSRFSDSELQEHPWLSAFQSASVPARLGVSEHAQRATRPHAEALPQLLTLDEQQIHEAWEELRSTREAWNANLQPLGEDFAVSLRGGAWTRQHRGVAADAVLATASSDLGKAFLRAFGEPKSASFSLLAYDHIATLLGQEWCARRQHFCNIWQLRGRAVSAFSPADIEAYVPSPAWTALMTRLTADDAAFSRASALHGYVPRVVGGPASSSSALPVV